MIQNLRVDLTFHLNFALRVLPTSRGQKNRVEEEMKECLSDIVNENCILTLSKKSEIHNRTVSRILQGMKLARPLPSERNRPHVIHKRYDSIVGL